MLSDARSSFSALTPKGLKCPFCKLLVYNKNKHCYQCPVMFQVAFQWHAGRPAESQVKPSSGSGKTQVTLPMAFKGPATASPPLTSTQQAMRLLTNTANAWFINSVLQALFQVRRPDFDFRLCAVLEEMRTTSDSRPLNLYSSFALRSLARGWRFDGRQHDAAEFFSAISQGPGPLQLTPWQARVDGVVEVDEVGPTPLFLPVLEGDSLQGLLSAWSERGFQCGLLQAPDVLPVVLGRWADGAKNSASITGFRAEPTVPVWQEGQTRVQARYKLGAGVLHIGDSVSASHYRAFWRLSEAGLMISDDFQAPVLAGPSDLSRIYRGAYLCFLLRVD